MSKNRYPRLLGLLPLLGTLLLGGCNMTLLDPKGQVGLDQRNLIITATLLMLLVVVPVIVMTFLFAWKYRASNTNATYTPKWSHSTKIEIAVWAVPVLIIIALGYITYKSTHELDPYRPLESDVKPVTIEVVALDWKWLFIYPEQGIATVNKIVFPAQHADQLPDHLRRRDELVLHPGPGRPDLRDGGHADQAAPDRQPQR